MGLVEIGWGDILLGEMLTDTCPGTFVGITFTKGRVSVLGIVEAGTQTRELL